VGDAYHRVYLGSDNRLPRSVAKRASGHGGGRETVPGGCWAALLISLLMLLGDGHYYLLLPPCPWLVIVSIAQ
jgi:hypothetical protein